MGTEIDGVNGIIKNTTSDGDVTIKGNDGGSEISALVFDMSAEGAATFNSTVALTSFAATDGCTITTADNDPQLTLVSTDADGASGPNLTLYRNSSSPADNDQCGRIKFIGRNDNSQDFDASYFTVSSVDVSDGSEDANMEWYVKTAGSDQLKLSMKPTETIFNEASADLDFRVESNGDTHMLFVDAGNDHVNIKASADLGGVLNVGGTTVIQTSDNTDTLTLVSTDTDSAIGPNLNLYRNAGNGADADNLATVAFAGNDDAGNATDFARITAQIDDASNGSEDVYFEFRTLVAGSERKRMSLLQTETVFNDDSVDLDFRVESNGNTHMIFVDANSDHVNIGQAGDSEHTLNVNGNGFFTTADNTDTLTLESTDADANSGPVLCLHRNSGSPADSDLIGRIDFSGESNLGSEQNYAVIKTFADAVAHGSESGQFSLFTRVAGSEIERMSCGAAATVFNDGSADLDFRVESNGQTHMLFVDGGNDSVNIGAADVSGDDDGSLNIQSTGSKYAIKIFTAGTGTAGQLRFHNDNGTVGAISINGSTTTYATSSDYRLKENVNYSWDATTQLKRLKPAKFNFIADANTTVEGFLAHEVADVVPIAVNGEKDAVNDDGNIISQSIDQSKLVPLLVKTIQELEARIKTLEG